MGIKLSTRCKVTEAKMEERERKERGKEAKRETSCSGVRLETSFRNFPRGSDRALWQGDVSM